MRWVVALMLLTACSLGRAVPTAHRTPEPNVWSVCYEPDGSVMNYEGACEKPQLLVWQLPVGVYIDPTYPAPANVHEAVVAWNEWLGMEVFRVQADLMGAGVHVVDGGPPIWAAGMAVHVRKPEGVLFTLSMYDGYHARTDVLAHEFGHVLGLAHDPDNKRSIMFPSGSWYLASVTRSDCAFLGRMYGRRMACE